MIRILVLALLAVCAPAFAASAGVTSFAPYAYQSGASSFVVAAGSNGTPIALAARSVTTGTAGEFLIRDMFNAAGPAGNLPLTATRTVSGLGAARAILGQAAKGFTPVAIGLAGYDLMQAYRMRGSGGGLEVDPGAPPVPRTVYNTAGFSGTSDTASCALYAKSNAAYAGTYEVFVDGYPVRYTYESRPRVFFGPDTYGTRLYCYVDVYRKDGTLHSLKYRKEPLNSSVESSSCTEAATGALMPTGADGKCMTGRYEASSVEAAAGTLAAAMTVAAVKDYVNSPASQAEPVPESKPMKVTGPATQVGVPKTVTTTSPTGTISETRTPTYTYNYAGNTVNYSTVNQTVTNITNNEGATETTTETKPEDIQKGDCELYPKSVGCLDMGEFPDEEVPEEEREVDISPEDVDLPSGCPADVALPGGRTLSYASACAAAEDVAPLVIAAGVLSALLIAVAAIRGS